MAKTKEELNALKRECEALTTKLQELSEEELKMVTGGKDIVKLGLSLNYSVFFFENVNNDKMILDKLFVISVT